jgi:hypothetical protein
MEHRVNRFAGGKAQIDRAKNYHYNLSQIQQDLSFMIAEFGLSGYPLGGEDEHHHPGMGKGVSGGRTPD